MLSRIALAMLVAFASQTLSRAPETSAPAASQARPAGTYWCPMHPNIRGAKGEVCRICHMALVPAPPPDYSAYHVAVETEPRAPRAGAKTRVRLTISDPRTNATVKDFETVHDKLLHMFVLNQDLEYFAHVHPTLENGSFVYTIVFPRPGAYRLIADFVPVGGSQQLVQQTVVTAGYGGSLIPTARPIEDVGEKVVEDVRARLSMPTPIAGREQLLTLEFVDRVTGAPVTDLEPYLGAVGHLFLVSADLETAAHSHPVAEMSASVGPAIVFQALFPRPGPHRFWVQVQRHHRVLTVPFTVDVRPRDQNGG